MLRYYLLPINHYLLNLVGLTFTYLKFTDFKFVFKFFWPPCNALVPYCYLWSVWLYNITAHYLI